MLIVSAAPNICQNNGEVREDGCDKILDVTRKHYINS